MMIKNLVALNFLMCALACTSGASNTPQQPTNTTPQTTQAQAGNTPVKVGDVAPDFTLEDQNGQAVKLSEAREKTPVVLVFYRGYW